MTWTPGCLKNFFSLLSFAWFPGIWFLSLIALLFHLVSPQKSLLCFGEGKKIFFPRKILFPRIVSSSFLEQRWIFTLLLTEKQRPPKEDCNVNPWTTVKLVDFPELRTAKLLPLHFSDVLSASCHFETQFCFLKYQI